MDVELAMLWRSLPPDTALRTLRRKLPHQLEQMSRRLHTYVCMLERSGRLFVVFQCVTVDDDGVCLNQFRIDYLRGALSYMPLILIKPHAIARLMQRAGPTDFSAVRLPVLDALTTAFSLGPKILSAGWRQVGIPASGGVFAGHDNDRGTLELSTWFIPGANGRVSRW
ncbi:hypothetical protein [Paraburkholderia hospita]|uniref:hypothetical protein n=1 Tax=Paraburkholderia hospita TaxID=169430 RepID=UPI001178AD59|nr:hypothetical protein [Paraburkholderia hospita]